MMWQQGEADARWDAPATAGEDYGLNLAHLINNVRTRFKQPDMPFVYGAVLPRPGGRFTGRDLVRKGQRDVAEGSGASVAMSGALLVDTDALQLRSDEPGAGAPKDVVHFGTQGQLELGKLFAEALNGARQRAGR